MAAPWSVASKSWRYPIFFPDYTTSDFETALHSAWNPESRMCQFLLGTCRRPCAIREYAASAAAWLSAQSSASDDEAATAALHFDTTPEASVSWELLERAEGATVIPADPLSDYVVNTDKLLVVDESVLAKQKQAREEIAARKTK